jgi:putative transposase
MSEDRVVELRQPGSFSDDPLTEILRLGARELLAQAVEAEVSAFIAEHGDLRGADGRRRVVRHGHLPAREIQTGIGPVAVRQPRVRDRGAGDGGAKIHFTSAILPPYLRRAKSIEELLPWLYLKGISTGDFSEALAALLGPDAPGLSASNIARLKGVWQGELARWEKRDLSTRRYLYFWADGIYFQPRMEHDKQCILVIIGADQWGRKELLAIADGYRESAQSWREVLLDLKHRGLKAAPELAIGDGALGFWKALREIHPMTREQRCWLHKTGNVLNSFPKSLQAKAKGHLQDIWMAETRDQAKKAFDFFLQAYGAKYHKAAQCLAKDRDTLLTFYDFPAEHWKHLRTTNPIESTFATVRLRTIKTKGCLSRTTALTMVFKLCQSASKKWRRLDGAHRLAEIIEGVKFKDGEKLIVRAA